MQLRVNIPVELDWEASVVDYPAVGQPGITYRKDTAGESGSEAVSEALLFYGPDGSLAGVVNYFPNDIWTDGPSRLLIERAGHFSVVVAPKCQRRGIGTRLLREATKRWPIDFEHQYYSLSGAMLVQHFLQASASGKARAKKAQARRKG